MKLPDKGEIKMTEEIEQKMSLGRRIWRIFQWAIAAFLLFGSILSMSDPDNKLAAPGAPVVGYLLVAGILAVIAIVLMPPAFFRLPTRGKVGAYFAAFVAMGFSGNLGAEVDAAYERTPAGAEQAAEHKAEREAAAAQREIDETLAGAREGLEQLQEIQEQQEDCLSWGGELASLNEIVEENLHNRGSFKHLATRFIVGADQYNVEMTFEAENGFGATRTSRVLAVMDPESCEITAVSELSE